MTLTEVARIEAAQYLSLEGGEFKWELVRSSAAKKLRIKVGPDGVRVVMPEGRDSREAAAFLAKNSAWVLRQLERTRKLLAARRPAKRAVGRILFQGDTVTVGVIHSECWRGPNKVILADSAITIVVGEASKTEASRSLENWLRKRARERIESHVEVIGKRLKRRPNRIYVMGQRTKWGNCSALGNTSFNWRLVMAPDFVLQYIVAHEVVHLAIPDHSKSFWLTVQSHCPQTEKARQWLVANSHKLKVDLRECFL